MLAIISVIHEVMVIKAPKSMSTKMGKTLLNEMSVQSSEQCELCDCVTSEATRAGDAYTDSNIVDLFRMKIRAILFSIGVSWV